MRDFKHVEALISALEKNLTARFRKGKIMKTIEIERNASLDANILEVTFKRSNCYECKLDAIHVNCILNQRDQVFAFLYLYKKGEQQKQDIASYFVSEISTLASVNSLTLDAAHKLFVKTSLARIEKALASVNAKDTSYEAFRDVERVAYSFYITYAEQYNKAKLETDAYNEYKKSYRAKRKAAKANSTSQDATQENLQQAALQVQETREVKCYNVYLLTSKNKRFPSSLKNATGIDAKTLERVKQALDASAQRYEIEAIYA